MIYNIKIQYDILLIYSNTVRENYMKTQYVHVHLNVILLFLSDCGILQFTPSLRSEQNGTAPS